MESNTAFAVLSLFSLCLGVYSTPTKSQEAANSSMYEFYYTHPTTGVRVSHLSTSGGLKDKENNYGFLPCDCRGEDIGCGCCAGVNIPYFNWKRTACMNMTYDPYEFAIGMNFILDDKSVYRNSLSGKNPPPVCIPIPSPIPLTPTLDFCVKLFDIFTPPPGVNLHMCAKFETRISRAPVLVLEFDCLRMGSSGVFVLKPEDNGLVPGTGAGGTEEGQEAVDEYDEVTEDKKKT